MKKAQKLLVTPAKSTGLIITLTKMRALPKVRLANQKHLRGGKKYMCYVSLWKVTFKYVFMYKIRFPTIRLYQNLTISLRTTKVFCLLSCSV